MELSQQWPPRWRHTAVYLTGRIETDPRTGNPHVEIHSFAPLLLVLVQLQ